MSTAVDEGILNLTQRGRLTATSCLTDGPTWVANAPRLRELPIDAGVHLNFTEAFAESDFRLPLGRLIRACYLRQLPKSRVADEIERQFDAFERHFGRAPDFVDGHQHVHQLPIIRDCLWPILERRYSGRPLWLRSTLAPAALADYRLKARIIAALGARKFVAQAAQRRISTNGHLLGVYDFSASETAYAQLLQNWLKAADDGDLLMCHPAVPASAGAATGARPDAIGAQRPTEYAVLSDACFDDWLATASAQPVRLSQID